MTTNELFIFATRNKIRFPFRGQISVEDLWDLSLVNLDSIYKELNAKVKQAKEESLLETKNKSDTILDVQIEIIKYIVSTKLEERAAREQEVKKNELRQQLLAVKARKQNEAIENLTEEEINKKLAELE